MRTIKVKVGENRDECDIHLFPGQNLYTGIKAFETEFKFSNTLEEDLLNLSSGIYATDLAVKREEREHYIRNIELIVEVINLHAFGRIKELLENALLTVSRDNWTITFIQRKGTPISDFDWQEKDGAVLLFSGGLDSMCAASEFIKNDMNLVLVSHNSQGNIVIDKCQRNIHLLLEKYYKRSIKHVRIKVYGRKQGDFEFPKEREPTQRTRSFLFLCLAALVSRRSGFNKVLYMAENGQFSIHLPLNQARIGPFSTHTADPQFVEIVKEIIRVLLSNPNFDIINPFLYRTKAEVFSMLPNDLQKESYLSASCWMIHYTPGNKHCGYCIPCISRRIAIEFNGIHFNEYANDIFNLDLNNLSDSDDKKRNIIDYLEFISKFKKVTDINRNEIIMEFPELINPSFDIDKALKLYERVSFQSFKVFKNYPEILKIIG